MSRWFRPPLGNGAEEPAGVDCKEMAPSQPPVRSLSRFQPIPSAVSLDPPSYACSGQDALEYGESGLVYYWRILCWRKRTVLLLGLLGSLAGFLITSSLPKTYQAHVSLEVQDIDQDFPNIKSRGAQTDAFSDIPTQIRLLQSDGLMARTRAKLSSKGQEVPKGASVPWPVMGSRETLSKVATESVKVQSTGQARIIDVFVDSVDPRRAADFANILANEFIDQNIEARWKMSQRTGDWLGQQLESTRIKLERSEANLQAYARETGLLFTGGDGKASTNVSEEKLRQVQQSLSSAMADRAEKQSRYEIANLSPPEGLPDVLNDATLNGYRAKLTDLEREIADLTSQYTADYPKVKRLQAQLHSVKSAYALERAAILDRIKSQYDEAVRREELLASAYTIQARTVTGESEKAIRYTILKRDVDSNRQLFDAMLDRVKQAGIAAALRASNIRVVDEAAVPAFPYKPRITVNIALGLLTGLFLGFVFAVGRERADRSLRGPGQTTLWLNVPELGIIPSGKHRLAKRRYDLGMSVWDGQRLPGLLVDNAGSHALGECPELVTLHRTSSMMAEAFRVVLPHLVFPNHGRNDLRVIMLTSANPAEGKTTVACNLAIAIAEIGKKVLLIDADLRRPHLHNVFALNNAVGLTSILQGGPSVKAMLQASIKSTPSENLHVLPSGPAIRDPGKTLFTEYFPELFATLKQQFEVVLIDAPPILQLPDARVLGRLADGVILVVRAGHTSREAAVAAYESLIDVQCYVLGTILNYWDPKRSPFGYEAYRYSD